MIVENCENNNKFSGVHWSVSCILLSTDQMDPMGDGGDCRGWRELVLFCRVHNAATAFPSIRFRFHREVRNMKFCISIHGSTRSYINNSAENIQREIHQSGGFSGVFVSNSLGSEAGATCFFSSAQPTKGGKRRTQFCCYCMDKAIRNNG